MVLKFLLRRGVPCALLSAPLLLLAQDAAKDKATPPQETKSAKFEVVESIVIGQDWPPGAVGDVRVVLFVRLRDGLVLDQALSERIKKQIRANTTPRHVPAKIVQVSDIPRTKSGKIVELAVRNVVHGEPVKNVEALANPEALEQFRNRAELKS